MHSLRFPLWPAAGVEHVTMFGRAAARVRLVKSVLVANRLHPARVIDAWLLLGIGLPEASVELSKMAGVLAKASLASPSWLCMFLTRPRAGAARFLGRLIE